MRQTQKLKLKAFRRCIDDRGCVATAIKDTGWDVSPMYSADGLIGNENIRERFNRFQRF